MTMVVVSNIMSAKKSPNKNKNTPNKNKNTPNKNFNKMTPAKVANTPNKNTPNKNKNTPINNKSTPGKGKPTPKKIISKVEENSDEMSEEESDEDMPFNKGNGNNVDEHSSAEENNDSGDVEDDDDDDDDEDDDENVADEDDDENVADEDDDDEDDDDDEADDDEEEEKITTPTKTVKRKNTDTDKEVPSKIAKTELDDKAEKTIFVGKLPGNTDEDDIRKFFKKFGPIESVRFTLTPNQKRNKICFVVFKNKDSVTKSMAADGENFNGQHVQIDTANYDKKKSIGIKNLPADTKRQQVLKAFSKCGKVTSVRLIRDIETGVGKGIGFVSFDSDEAIESALKMKVKFGTNDIQIERDLDKIEIKFDHSVHIRNVPKDANHEKIKKLFEHCGTIKNVKLVLPKPNKPKLTIGFGFIQFENDDAVNNALNMKTVKLGENEITINATGIKIATDDFKEDSTIFGYKLPTNTKEEDLKKIFSKCGTIKNIVIKPYKNCCFLEFAKPAAAQKALELTNLKLGDEELHFKKFEPNPKKSTAHQRDFSRSIFVKNLPENVKEADIKKIFKDCGKVESMRLQTGFGFVNFETSEAFEAALQLENVKLGDNELVIQKQKPPTKKQKFVNKGRITKAKHLLQNKMVTSPKGGKAAKFNKTKKTKANKE